MATLPGPGSETPIDSGNGLAFETAVRWFQFFDESTRTSQNRAKRDRDYYDGFQWTDEELRDEELKLLRNTRVDLETLRPQVGDDETFDRLMEAVQEATARNESLAQLQNRVQKLGKQGITLAKKIYKLLS